MSAPTPPPNSTPQPTAPPTVAPAGTQPPAPPQPVAPVAAPKKTSSLQSDTPTPKAPVAAPKTKVPAPAVKAEPTQSLNKIRLQYLQARFTSAFGRMRRHVQFFIMCVLFLFTTIWIFAKAWQLEKAGENENWFHEGLGVSIMLLLLVVFYFRLYRKSQIFLMAQARHEAAEKAILEAKLKLEEEQKRQAFLGLIKDFQAANTYEQIGSSMAKLLTVGLESTLLRQQAVDLLCDLNKWMIEQKVFMGTQNLIIWRLKNSLFETSERFNVDSSTQDLSIKAINIVEAITKKHLTDFADGRSKEPLDLRGKALPTLTLTAQRIPPGSLLLDEALLWQASFAETTLKDLSFAGADLQTASFWRAQLENIDFADTNLKFSKLRTNLQSVKNLTGPQFFSTKEWELCYLSKEQESAFFATTENPPEGAQDQWDSSEPRRRKLYFQLIKNANALKTT